MKKIGKLFNVLEDGFGVIINCLIELLTLNKDERFSREEMSRIAVAESKLIKRRYYCGEANPVEKVILENGRTIELTLL